MSANPPVVGPPDALSSTLARDFQAEAERAIAGRGLFSVALPGGSVADHAFGVLAALPLPWHLVRFFQVDERAVPPSDPESNYALARRLWFDPVGVPGTSIHRMPADAADLAGAARDYATELVHVVGPRVRLDYVLLGVGPDGHVASLFPGHPAASEETQSVVAVLDSPKPPPRRLTLTMPVLAGAERVVVMALGASKAAAIREALENESSRLPVAVVLARTTRPLVLLDPAAACELRRTDRPLRGG